MNTQGPYSYHQNEYEVWDREWELEHTVHCSHTQKKNTSSTNTIKPNVKQELNRESQNKCKRVRKSSSSNSRKKIGIRSNKRFTDARNSMKCDALLLTEWFSLFYTKTIPKIHSTEKYMSVCVFALCNGKYIYTSDIYLVCFFFVIVVLVVIVVFLLFLGMKPSILAMAWLQFVQPYFHVLCGVCCANF